MSRAEALLDAHDAGENLLRDESGVGDDLDIAETKIARGAVSGVILLAKIMHECAMTADGAARVTIDLVDLMQRMPDVLTRWGAAGYQWGAAALGGALRQRSPGNSFPTMNIRRRICQPTSGF